MGTVRSTSQTSRPTSRRSRPDARDDHERRDRVVSRPMREGAHRPYPAPTGPWLLRMTWHDLLFAHWRVDAASLRPRVPPGLEIETFDGSAWLGVVPFTMSGVRGRWM